MDHTLSITSKNSLPNLRILRFSPTLFPTSFMVVRLYTEGYEPSEFMSVNAVRYGCVSACRCPGVQARLGAKPARSPSPPRGCLCRRPAVQTVGVHFQLLLHSADAPAPLDDRTTLCRLL